MQEYLAHLIVEFYEKLSSWEHGVVRDQDLTLPQMHTLEILGVHGPLRMKELAEKMGVTTGTLTVQVDRLEAKGLLARTPNPEDRRSYLVELLDQGTALYREHDKLHKRMTDDVTAGLSDQEINCLVQVLQKMNNAF